MKTFMHKNWLSLVAIVMLAVVLVSSFTASFALPYAYYQLMNWVVVGASVVTAMYAKKIGRPCAMWVFALIAVIFNPIAPLYLGTLTWEIADIVAIVLIVVSFFALKEKKLINI